MRFDFYFCLTCDFEAWIFGFLGHIFWEIDFGTQYHLLGRGSLYGIFMGFEL